MKYINILVVMFCFIISCKKKEIIERCYYSNGNLSSECVVYKDSTRLCKTYFEDGKIESNYMLDEYNNLFGGFLSFYRNGNIRHRKYYSDGLLFGEELEYDSLGKLINDDYYILGNKVLDKQFYIENNETLVKIYGIQGKHANYLGKLTYDLKGQIIEGKSLYYTAYLKSDTIILGETLDIKFNFFPYFKYVKIIFGRFDPTYNLINNDNDTVLVVNNKCNYLIKPTDKGLYRIRGVVIEYDTVFSKSGYKINERRLPIFKDVLVNEN